MIILLEQKIVGTVDEQYRDRSIDFFKIYDNKNCERIYNAIENLD